ncbi:MAG: YigZ family protein [Erysipelotrichaceae bacterium]|nr:YigZ family protein [Erysipelotrichaceae bacterium]
MSNPIRIKEDFNHTIIIEKSKFICYIRKTLDEDSAKTFINEIRKKHYNATHVCTAYVIGNDIQKSNDDNEPSGTAGIPMLTTIKNMNVVDVCVCVVRYFGGIKLGAGGLVRAYSNSVSETINLAPKVKMENYRFYEISFPYNLINKIEYLLSNNTVILDRNYDLDVTFKFRCLDDSIEKDIQMLTNGQYLAKFIEEKEIEINI